MAAKKTENPFMNFDVTKMMADFDPSAMVEEFTKMAQQYNLPGLDLDTVIQAQRKNIEALTTANRVALEGVQAVTKRQTEILQASIAEMQDVLSSFTASGTPQDAAAKQVEVTKATFEKTLDNMRELSEMLSKSSGEAADAINKRIAEGLDEMKSLALSMKK
ncbi:MAG: phasin family protein [Rhodobacterales bacterium]|nr:phasin family protein [Rhodobacterales bacterium]